MTEMGTLRTASGHPMSRAFALVATFAEPGRRPDKSERRPAPRSEERAFLLAEPRGQKPEPTQQG